MIRVQFELHRNLTDPTEIKEKIQQGHDQVDIAVHYQIPYKRLHHADPHTTLTEQSYDYLSNRKNVTQSKEVKFAKMKEFKIDK